MCACSASSAALGDQQFQYILRTPMDDATAAIGQLTEQAG
jgi:hypothetical protein